MVNTCNNYSSMTVEETHLKGSYIISPKIFEDSRGCFFEIYNEQIIDLLRNDTKSPSSLKVQETKSKDIEIQNITYKTVTKYEDVIELIA